MNEQTTASSGSPSFRNAPTSWFWPLASCQGSGEPAEYEPDRRFAGHHWYSLSFAAPAICHAALPLENIFP